MLKDCLEKLQNCDCYLGGGECMDECSSIVFDGEMFPYAYGDSIGNTIENTRQIILDLEGADEKSYYTIDCTSDQIILTADVTAKDLKDKLEHASHNIIITLSPCTVIEKHSIENAVRYSLTELSP